MMIVCLFNCPPLLELIKYTQTQYQRIILFSFITDQPSINATLPEEDASQDLYESAASLIRDSPPPSSPPSPSLLSGYDPILTQTVVPHIQEQTDRTDKQK